jgi:hypothetical protein
MSKATKHVEWPGNPPWACDMHARQAEVSASAMGVDIKITDAAPGHECDCCGVIGK